MVLNQESYNGWSLLLPPFEKGEDDCALLHKLQPEQIDHPHFFAPNEY